MFHYISGFLTSLVDSTAKFITNSVDGLARGVADVSRLDMIYPQGDSYAVKWFEGKGNSTYADFQKLVGTNETFAKRVENIGKEYTSGNLTYLDAYREVYELGTAHGITMYSRGIDKILSNLKKANTTDTTAKAEYTSPTTYTLNR